MDVVTGRWREAHLYLRYATAPLRPGARLPVFEEPTKPEWPLRSELDVPQLDLIMSEARRQLDRQRADLESLRTRSNALVALCLVELGLLSAGASKVFKHGLLIVPWALSVVAVLLALGGAIALVSARADFSGVNIFGLAAAKPPLHRVATKAYVGATSTGDVTIAARVTVFRDAVLLAIVGALLYAALWPVTTFQPSSIQNPRPANSEVSKCPTCTPSWPARSSIPATPTTTSPRQRPESPHP